MGIVLAVELAPVAILGIPSGTVISRWGARRVMVVSDFVRTPLARVDPDPPRRSAVLSFPVLLVLVALIGVFLAPYYASQRLILPELVGDDERTVAQANAVLEGAQRATSLLGPATAGVLIATFGAPVVLYVDAATFFVSFVLLALFVPSRPPLAQTEESGGVLAGIRFLLRDRLLRVLGVTALITNGLGQMIGAGLTVLAYEEYDSSRVAGLLFAAFGIGAVLGSVVAVRLVNRFEPLRLGATAFVALTVPIFALAIELPVPVADGGARHVVVLQPARQRAADRRHHDANARGAPCQGDDRRPDDGAARRPDRPARRRPAARELGAASGLPARRDRAAPRDDPVRHRRVPEQRSQPPEPA